MVTHSRDYHVLFLIILQIEEIVMKITKEENRVYSLYTCGIGGGFRSQEKCYEILNERRPTNEFNSRSSQKEHYYKIKW